jgi:hypothetical protein
MGDKKEVKVVSSLLYDFREVVQACDSPQPNEHVIHMFGYPQTPQTKITT